MIQRIQTFWLALTALLSAFLYGDHIIKFTDKADIGFFIAFTGIFRKTNDVTEPLGNTIPVSVVLILISVLSIFSIFLYRKRNLQIRTTLILIICSIMLTGLLIFYSFNVINSYDAKLILGYRIFFPPLILAFSLLAYGGIKSDEKLVKSYDRLR
jgi:hypothetical protein